MIPAEKKTGTKEVLLCAAEELFSQKGYAAVSTRELAQKAGVNLGAIQYHFGSKADLFVETIRRIMSRGEDTCEIGTFVFQAKNRAEAAIELFFFIRAFLQETCHPTGPDACRMMHREVLGATSENEEIFEALVSSVVEEFFRPVDSSLLELVGFLKPTASQEERVLILHSIYGQCMYYATDRPFIVGLRGLDYASEPLLSQVCAHITTFTLGGCDFSKDDIAQAIEHSQNQLALSHKGMHS